MNRTEPMDPFNLLLDEYAQTFRAWDDERLLRWLVQTLGQLYGEIWRLSHPLVMACRLAGGVAYERQLWLRGHVLWPEDYPRSTCCQAPLTPLFTRDILHSGLLCLHCNQTAVPFEQLPRRIQAEIRQWARAYQEIHAVAHWPEEQRRQVDDYEEVYEQAASEAEEMLRAVRLQILPRLARRFPILIWEDSDECLDVWPEDVLLDEED